MLLRKFDVMGVQFSDDFERNTVNVRFGKRYGDAIRTVNVHAQVPEPEIERRHRGPQSRKTYDDKREQLTRATYRALHDWLKAQFVSIEFGLSKFEEVFLPYFEWQLPDGSVHTTSELLIPRMSQPMLPASIEAEDIDYDDRVRVGDDV